MRKRYVRGAALAVLTLLLGACASDLPQDTFDTAGPVAESQRDLLVPVLWVALGVFIVVEGGILAIGLRYRHREGRERTPPQTHGNTRLEIAWTIAPAVVLAFVMVPTISLIWELDRRDPSALQVTVKGYQWWWGFEYTDPDMAVAYAEDAPIVTADTLVIPVGRPVQLAIEAAGGGARDDEGEPDHEVFHSFWAPRLFGKQDALIGEPGHILFSADEPGTYWGQCAEFCGLQHGRMKFRIVALEDAAWQEWVANQKREALTPADELASKGLDLFLTGAGNGQCIACHAVGGTEAVSNAAPDLTHFADPAHECFAGCNWDLYLEDGSPNVEDLAAWLRDPAAVKLGAKMPNYDLSDEEIEALVAYLYSLK